MDKVALIMFIVVIALAFMRKINAGILAIAVGAVAVRIFSMSDKNLLDGISGSMFATLVGINLLFAIVNNTGALDLLARKIVSISGKRNWILPIAIYMASFIIAAMTGAIPALAIIPVLAVSVAIEAGYNPIMLGMVGACGWSAGRMTPITPEGVIITAAADKAGLQNVMFPIMVCQIFATIIGCIILYFVFKGYKVKVAEGYLENKVVERFNTKQLISLGSVVIMLGLIVFLKLNVSVAAFSVVAVLLLFNIADESACIKVMPWGTIILVLGVGALLSVVDAVGGLQLFSNALAKLMNSTTAAPFMGISAGLLSMVSSSTGVVYPTMMPMCADIAAQVGNVNPIALMSAVGLGSSLTGVSPLSVAGALILSAMANNEKYSSKEQQGKVFVQLFAVSISSLILVVGASFFFNTIVNFMR